MSTKIPMPASGDGNDKGALDGVNDPGRGGGGDSAGGCYANPHEGKDGSGSAGRFFGYGGQTEIAYYGGVQAGSEGSGTSNATIKGGEAASGGGETGPKLGPTGPNQDLSPEYRRELEVGG